MFRHPYIISQQSHQSGPYAHEAVLLLNLTPNEFCQPHRGMIGKVCLRPVGTRGGRGEGWGPCACPSGMTMGLGAVRPTGLIPTMTSTRPPHPPHSAPCPYRMQDALSPIRSATFIRRRGRKRPNGYDYPIRLAKFIRVSRRCSC
jgi:hypothetical protein